MIIISLSFWLHGLRQRRLNAMTKSERSLGWVEIPKFSQLLIFVILQTSLFEPHTPPPSWCFSHLSGSATLRHFHLFFALLRVCQFWTCRGVASREWRCFAACGGLGAWSPPQRGLGRSPKIFWKGSIFHERKKQFHQFHKPSSFSLIDVLLLIDVT